MKNYLLTNDLLTELFKGEKLRKEKIISTLEDLIQKNESLFVSITTLNKILENEPQLKKRELILKNMNLLCEKILLLDKDDLTLALGLESQFEINHETATELLVAKKYNMDYILDISDKFKFQKMVSVVCLILKTK